MSELTLPFERILVTGGAGFIGSALVRHLIRYSQATVINVDALTYAGNPESLAECRDDPRHQFEHCDIRNASQLAAVFHRHQPEAVIHLAAESHVDRSIAGPAECVETNVVGTQNLLETARHYWQELEGAERNAFRLHHVSTDEIFGDLGPTDPPFSETKAFQPSSPYSASKAASNHLVNAWHRTYGLPTLITNCSNNYGPYQFPEKLIPLMVTNALEDRPLPVYGDGSNVRDWLHVGDHVQALCEVLVKGEIGRSYNIGGRSERTNLEVVSTICDHLDELRPERARPHRELVRMVADRPGHDRRYAIDDSRIRSELGWRPRETFESGLRQTVEWYLNNRDWADRVRSGAYRESIRTLTNDPASLS